MHPSIVYIILVILCAGNSNVSHLQSNNTAPEWVDEPDKEVNLK